MGINERKEREKAELSQLILKGAMEVFLEVGFENTSIRKIAERIEYSPGTIYVYFKDKDEILHELHHTAFDQLMEVMEKTAVHQEPIDQVYAIGDSYITFALENPQLYDLMFVLRAPMNAIHPECEWEDGFRTYEYFKSVLIKAVEKGQLKPVDPEVLCVTFWATVHGLVTLYLRERFQNLPQEQIEPLMRYSLREMVKQYELVTSDQ
ncbi:MAG: TetR/AcrR family transcriptional regulator [Saprospirales bacterium]|nr:TetR/AcrR family transcriptional regulator [Saprospirales bacterium]